MKFLIFIALFLLMASSQASEDILTMRSPNSFATTMVKLNELIAAKGYKITITQRCDFGLKEAGFKTDMYKVVNFGKLSEVRDLTSKHPQLAPFLPLRIAVIAEDNQTLLAILNPKLFLETVTEPELRAIIKSWQNNVSSIFKVINNKL